MAQPETHAARHVQQLHLQPPYDKLIFHCVNVSITTVFLFIFALFVILPSTMIPDVTIDPGSSLYSFNITPSQVSSRWDILVSVKNPNKHFPVKYTSIEVDMHYGNELLSRVLVHSFTQEPNNRTVLRANFNLTLNRMKNGWAVQRLESDYARGQISIDISLQAGRTFGLGDLNWWVRGIAIYFSCTDLIFSVTAGGEANISVIDDEWNNCKMGLSGYV